MTFQDYLDATARIAREEKDVLELLRARPFDKITLRAAKSSLQVLIENSIGKARKILQHYHCAVIPHESRDAFRILRDCEAIDEETAEALFSAVGFRNAMIHDYMHFDPKVLETLVQTRRYDAIYAFLTDPCRYSDLVRKRIENYTF